MIITSGMRLERPSNLKVSGFTRINPVQVKLLKRQNTVTPSLSFLWVQVKKDDPPLPPKSPFPHSQG